MEAHRSLPASDRTKESRAAASFLLHFRGGQREPEFDRTHRNLRHWFKAPTPHPGNSPWVRDQCDTLPHRVGPIQFVKGGARRSLGLRGRRPPLAVPKPTITWMSWLCRLDVTSSGPLLFAEGKQLRWVVGRYEVVVTLWRGSVGMVDRHLVDHVLTDSGYTPAQANHRWGNDLGAHKWWAIGGTLSCTAAASSNALRNCPGSPLFWTVAVRCRMGSPPLLLVRA